MCVRGRSVCIFKSSSAVWLFLLEKVNYTCMFTFGKTIRSLKSLEEKRARNIFLGLFVEYAPFTSSTHSMFVIVEGTLGVQSNPLI